MSDEAFAVFARAMVWAWVGVAMFAAWLAWDMRKDGGLWFCGMAVLALCMSYFWAAM
jgi:hypothetical protein